MLLIDAVSRILHVLTAITLVGGSIFVVCVLLPAAKTISEEAHETLAAAVSSRWKRFVHLGILLFLLTGFYNYFRAIPAHSGDGLYHALVGTKMLLAFGVFFIASALVGRSAGLAGIRKNRARWTTILVAMAIVIVSISGFVKVRGIPSQAAVENTANSTSQ